MTLENIYKKCKCWMFDKLSSTGNDDYIVEVANKILAETYEDNNMCRMFNNLLPLLSIPQIGDTGLATDLDDLGIMEEYQLEVIPKGIDAVLLMDDDLNKMSILRTEYDNARTMHQKMVSLTKIKELTEQANGN